MRLGRGLIVKIAVGVVAVGLLGFGVYSVVRDRMAKEYLRAEAVAKEKYDGSGIKADITSVKVAFAVRKDGVFWGFVSWFIGGQVGQKLCQQLYEQ